MKKQKKVLVDTNIILRYLLRDNEQFFKKTEELFTEVKAKQKKIIILESVLAECVYVLQKHYKIPRKDIYETLSDLLEYKGIINTNKKNLQNALVLFFKKNLDFVDCLLVSTANNYQLPIFTFDKQIAKTMENPM